MKRFLLLPILLFTTCFLFAQETENTNVQGTFKDTRVINSHTVETVQARKLDFRIGHRFGDLNGGWNTFYGLENATDVLFSFEYGVKDNLTIGLSRTKGAGPLKALLNGSAKYKVISQKTQNGSPVSITLMALATASTANKSAVPDLINSFEKSSHRFAYHFQGIIARKFSDGFSFQIMPGYTHRNIVTNEDENGLLSLGFATRIQLTKVIGFIADFTYPFSSFRNDNDYYPPFGVGIEIETGGHVFQVNFTNASGIMETDYIPNTQSNWGDGEFRLGFTISRMFNL